MQELCMRAKRLLRRNVNATSVSGHSLPNKEPEAHRRPNLTLLSPTTHAAHRDLHSFSRAGASPSTLPAGTDSFISVSCAGAAAAVVPLTAAGGSLCADRCGVLGTPPRSEAPGWKLRARAVSRQLR